MKSSLPSNHGLTVCWSVEATSVRCPACSERIWASMTSVEVTELADSGPIDRNLGTANQATPVTKRIAAAAASQRQAATDERFAPAPENLSSTRTFLRKP